MKPNNVLIVGGGPIGLLMGLMLAKQKIKTVIVEKRKDISRKQILIINNIVYESLPKIVRKNLFEHDSGSGCFVLPAAQANTDYKCFRKRTIKDQEIIPFASVRIDKLQSELVKYVHSIYDKLPIELIFGEISVDVTKNLAYIANRTIKYNILIGADGSNSYMRDKIFKILKDQAVYENLDRKQDWNHDKFQHVINRNYFMKDKSTTYYHPITKTSDDMKKWPEFKNHTVIATIKLPSAINKRFMQSKITSKQQWEWQEKHLKTIPQHHYRFFTTPSNSAYIAMTLSPSEFKKLKNSKTKIIKKIKDFLYEIYEIPQSSIIMDSDDVSFITVDLYRSRFFAKPLNSNSIGFLVGDAAFNTHYFTGNGLNVGILMAIKLTSLIVQYFKKSINAKNIIQKYDAYMNEAVDNVEGTSYEILVDYDNVKRVCNQLRPNDIELFQKRFNIKIPQKVSHRTKCDILAFAIYSNEYDIFAQENNKIRSKFRNDISFDELVNQTMNDIKNDIKSNTDDIIFLQLFPWAKIYITIVRNDLKNYRHQYISLHDLPKAIKKEIEKAIEPYLKCQFSKSQTVRWETIVSWMSNIYNSCMDSLFIEKKTIKQLKQEVQTDAWFEKFASVRYIKVECFKAMFIDILTKIEPYIGRIEKIYEKYVPGFPKHPMEVPDFYQKIQKRKNTPINNDKLARDIEKIFASK